MTKLLLIGLDGATFQVIKPLCQEGKLPNLNRLIKSGVHGILESTFPPVTAPAWTALATGKNPGKTGVFGFLNRIFEGSLEMKPLSSINMRRARSFWDHLSANGGSVTILNYPFLYPPYKINGVMVSGLGSHPGQDITYPRELKGELFEKCGGYGIDIPWSEKEYRESPLFFIKHVMELLDINEKAVRFLQTRPWDAFMFVISAGDFTQHYMWKYIDEHHPYHKSEEAGKYYPLFTKIWQRIDEIVGVALQNSSGRTNVMVVSDHGFGPYKKTFYINSWLEQEGYLARKKSRSFWHGLLKGPADRAFRLLPPRYRRDLQRTAGRHFSVATQVDLKRSSAFANIDGSAYCGSIFLSTHGGNETSLVKQRIVEKLKETCQNLGISLSIHLREQIYQGPYLKLAPDILFAVDDFECGVPPSFNREVLENPQPDPTHSGDHKMDGVLIACGPDIRQDLEIENVKIYDIAPTILHMFGLSVPDDIDGRVLKEIFKEGSEPTQREVKYQQVNTEKERIMSRIENLKRSGRI